MKMFHKMCYNRIREVIPTKTLSHLNVHSLEFKTPCSNENLMVTYHITLIKPPV